MWKEEWKEDDRKSSIIFSWVTTYSSMGQIETMLDKKFYHFFLARN